MTNLKERLGEDMIKEFQHLVREKFLSCKRTSSGRDYSIYGGPVAFFEKYRSFYELLAEWAGEKLSIWFLNLVDTGLYKEIERKGELEDLSLKRHNDNVGRPRREVSEQETMEIKKAFMEDPFITHIALEKKLPLYFVRRALEEAFGTEDVLEMRKMAVDREYKELGTIEDTAEVLGLKENTVEKYLKAEVA